MCPLVTARLISVAASLVFGALVPLFAMAALVPALEAGGATMRNFRGKEVVLGLGVVWIVWATSVALGRRLMLALAGFDPFVPGQVVLPLLVAAGAACAFGLVDDALGDSSAKGFKGHLGALRRGRLTTGGLKLFGIGCASVLASLMVEASVGGGVARVVLGTLALALTANLMNLMDLRPGRALKSYVGLLVFAVPAAAVWLPGVSVTEAAALGLLVFGPVAAVWSFDLGERGMLGDAGANALGAVAGVLFTAALPLPALGVYAAAVFALNLASEKVSFSRVIEGNRVLSAVDRAGRLP